MEEHEPKRHKPHSSARRIARHLSRLWHRKESVSQAGAKILNETQRLANSAVNPESEGRHREAVSCVQRGVQYFNAKRYGEAEEAFREAVELDSDYARAHLYLGNTLYKRQSHRQGVWHWRQAIEVEPRSAAAAAARKKLAHVEEQGNIVISELKNHLNGR